MVYNEYNMQPSSSTTKYYGAAAQYNKTSNGLGGLFKIIIIVLGVILLLSLGFIGFSLLTSAGKNDAARFWAREKQLLSFVTTNQSSITSDDFQTTNSNARSLLTSDLYAVQQSVKNSYGLTTIPDTIAKSEVDTTSATALQNATVQSRFDTVYVQLLRDKIASAESLARTVQNGSSDTLKTAVQTALNNLVIIDNQLAKLQL